MPYNFAADSFHTKKFCSRLCSSDCDFTRKSAVLRFWDPLGDLGATYDDHLRLIGKRIVDFLLVLIELFFARCYGWGAMGKYRMKIGDFAPTGSVDPKFHVQGVALTDHSFSQKTRLNDLSYDIQIWTDLSSILSGITHVTDRQMDRILIARPRLHFMQRGKKLCVF